MIKINKERIDEFLKFRRWNRTDLAKALNFSESYITLLLNEDREPSREFMERLVMLTGLSLDALFFCSNSYQDVSKDDNKLQEGKKDVHPTQEN